MPVSPRSERLFREMHKLTAELDAIGHERDEAQIDGREVARFGTVVID
jgi:hypothetical protein